MLALVNGAPQQDDPVGSLLATDTPAIKPPDTQEMALLQKDLGRIDPGVLRLAHQNGLRVQLVRPGESLADTRLLQAHPAADIDRQIPAMRDYTARMHRDVSEKYDGHPEQRGQRNQAVLARTMQSGLPFKPFTIEPPGKLAGTPYYGQIMGEAERPWSTQGMAGMMGARTPEEFAQFNRWTEDINGDRLTAARAASMQQLDEQIRSHPKDASLLEQRAQQLQHPELIPVDHRRFDIMVPDHYLYRAGDSGDPARVRPMEVGFKGMSTIQDMNDPRTGKILDRASPRNPEGTVLNGAYFDETNRLMVTRASLGEGTAIHEVGHAIEHYVQKADPAFYGSWAPRLDQAYLAADASGPGHQITPYSRKNPGEYFAEGFMLFHQDPKRMKLQDPTLFGLVNEMNQRAIELSRGQ